MIELGGRLRFAEQLGELIEGGDFDRARAGELLLHAIERRVRQNPAIGLDHPLPIVTSGGLGIDVQRESPRHAGNRRRRGRQLHPEHFVEVRRGIRAHQQDALRRRRPKAIAVAQAREVLPTPPLPVKNRFRVGFLSISTVHVLPRRGT
jgi:hypothetical protein